MHPSCADRRERLVWAPPAAVYAALEHLGDPRCRYYGAAPLWRLRTLLAPIITAESRGAHTAAAVRVVGDRVDYWRVTCASPPHDFALVCRMRMIGNASLAWRIEPRPGGRSLVVQTATIETGDPLGRAYWVASLPLHRAAFESLLCGIARQAESQAPRPDPARPSRGLRVLRREQIVPRTIDAAFAFFADAGNLQAITPDWLHFRILTPLPITLREGALIDYRIRLHGIPIGWRTRIDVWDPPHRFVDRQLRGPYRWWHHEHRFEPVAGGTRVIDEVEYSAPLRWISEPLLVRRDVERIFDVRAERLARLLGGA
ncbi:MAG: DUF2867 domain-containing protein [Phycisphaerales bacterium]